MRSSSLLALALDSLSNRQSPLAKAVQDLAALDGALARLATALQMDVTEPDTALAPEDAVDSESQAQGQPSRT